MSVYLSILHVLHCFTAHCFQLLNVSLVTWSLSPAQLLAGPASPRPGARSLEPEKEKEKLEQHNNSDKEKGQRTDKTGKTGGIPSYILLRVKENRLPTCIMDDSHGSDS